MKRIILLFLPLVPFFNGFKIIFRACIVLYVSIIFSSCAVYKKSGYPHSLKLGEIEAGTELKVVTKRKIVRVSLYSTTDSLLIGSRGNSNTAIKIAIQDIKEIWIRSYHDSTSRKGFFIGYGLGASDSFRNFSSGTGRGYFNGSYSDSKVGVTTEFRIGHAFSDKFAIYYRNRNIYSNDYHFSNGNDETFLTSFTGVGTVYYLRNVAPTFYGNMSVGFGISGFAGSLSETNKNKGLATGVGLGYQFTRRWNVELDFDFMRLKPDAISQIPEHARSSLSLTLLYSWFKNYR